MIHKPTYRRNCCANDLFCSGGNVLECGNCGAREDDEDGRQTKSKNSL